MFLAIFDWADRIVVGVTHPEDIDWLSESIEPIDDIKFDYYII